MHNDINFDIRILVAPMIDCIRRIPESRDGLQHARTRIDLKHIRSRCALSALAGARVGTLHGFLLLQLVLLVLLQRLGHIRLSKKYTRWIPFKNEKIEKKI